MQTCTFYKTTESGQQKVIGKIILTGARLSIQPADNEVLQNILEEENRLENNTLVSAVSSPRAWFAALPRKFNGVYLRAQIS